MRFSPSSSAVCCLWALLFCLPTAARAQTLNINNDVQKFATLANTTATLTGKAELHVSDANDPIAGSVIHLNSPDAWFFMTNIAPSRVASTFVNRVRVNGAAAVIDANVRIVQFGLGAVVIPHGPAYTPMEVFDGRHLTGPSKQLRLYTYYNEINLGELKGAISSFRLKRGYMATIAQQANGSGASKVYIAQDGDLEVPLLPANLDNNIRFVRVFPWRWVGKKGWAGGDGQNMRPLWWYDWGSGPNSSLDTEYVPMRHNEWWDAYPNNKTNVTHVLGYNEPERADQGNVSVDTALARWPELMASGLRLGSPAPSDGGLAWLYEFIDRADALGYRVDYVAVHYYHGGRTAQQFYDWLLAVHQRVRRPLWVTEFNNGANWTCCDPTPETQKVIIGQFIDMLDNAPFVERYSIYNWVGDNRRMVWDGGSPTLAGETYRDNASPLSQTQELPDAGTDATAYYSFNGDARDSSGNGYDAMSMGVPIYSPGKYDAAITLDGATDFLQVSPRLGDSTDFTFGAWIYWEGGGNWQRVFDFGDGTGRYLYLSPKSGSNTLLFTIKNGGAEQQLSAPALPVGQWRHVAVTITGSTGKLFVNGSLVATNTAMTINPVDVGTEANFIGKSQFSADPLFRGRIDDARFLTTALTDAQVSAMAAGVPPQWSGNPVVLGDAVKFVPYTSSLVGKTTAGSGALKFSKMGGPAWLAVAANGSLTGVPGATDGGLNRFLVKVTDATGALSSTILQITVADQPGLVARYAFDLSANATVGTAHGTSTGSPTYPTGRHGSAIDLDGVDDFVTLPPGIADYGEITVATWVNWDGGAVWQRIFDFGNGTGEHMFLTPRSGSNSLRFVIKNNGGEQILDAGQLATGQWVHVAVALGGNTGRLYVNGTLVDTEAISLKPANFAPASNFIGKSQFPDPLFNGRIDEFLVFNQVLSATQIAGLVNGRAPAFTSDVMNKPTAVPGQAYEQTVAGSAVDADAGATLVYNKVSGPAWLTVLPYGRISGVPTAADAGTNRFVVRVTDETSLADDATLNILVAGSPGVYAHYQFDGNTAENSGGAAAVPTGSPVYAAGLFDRAIRLDGIDDFIRLPAGLVSSLTDITIAARVRWDGGAIWQRIFDFGSSTTKYMVLTPRSVAETLRFTISINGNAAGAEQIMEGPALPIGEWSHVAVTLLGNTGTLYVNGAAVDSRTITLDPASVAPLNNYIGKSQFPDPLLNGSVDDFRVYNRGLSATEISALAVPVAPVVVPDHSFSGWAWNTAFSSGQGLPQADPDGDGLANLIEYLFGLDPLGSGSGVLPGGRILTGSALGLIGNPEKTYLTLDVRVRKQRPGVTLVPEAAASVADLETPAAATHALQAGPAVSDGEYEVITYYYDVAIEDAAGGLGVIRLRAILQ